MPIPPPAPTREICWRCHRARRACFCERIRSFECGPRFAVLIHPKEHKHRVGTARIVELAIQGTALIRGSGPELDRNPQLQALLKDPTLQPMVLYPGPQSIDLSQAGRSLVAQGKRLLIIAIDGTWAQAQQMVRDSRLLSCLPRIGFRPRSHSRYQFRRQPREHCLSTVEAVHEVIEILEERGIYPAPPARGQDNLIEVFEWMVQFQLSSASAGLLRSIKKT